MRFPTSLLLACVALGACRAGSSAPAPALTAVASASRAEPVDPARREAALALAERYATYRWTGREANVLHGPDDEGVPVDTPDASFTAQGWRAGVEYAGVPYAWGGFSSLDEFEAGLAAGLAAGYIPTSRGAATCARADSRETPTAPPESPVRTGQGRPFVFRSRNRVTGPGIRSRTG